jgi:hypothetical protein
MLSIWVSQKEGGNGAVYERYTEDGGLSKRGEEKTGRKRADGAAVTCGAIDPPCGD